MGRNDSPDNHPSFWCEYEAPRSHVSALVQMPAYKIDGYSLAVAYMRDCRESRRPLPRQEDDGR